MPIVYQEQDEQTGIKTRVHHLEDAGKTVIEKTYDAEPFLQTAAEARANTAGERWGEMRHVGFIPMAVLATLMRQDGTIDKKRVMRWLKENPAMVTFEKVLK